MKSEEQIQERRTELRDVLKYGQITEKEMEELHTLNWVLDE